MGSEHYYTCKKKDCAYCNRRLLKGDRKQFLKDMNLHYDEIQTVQEQRKPLPVKGNSQGH